MTNYKYKELFKQDSVDKQMKITFEGGEISNEDIYAESFTLKESLCSDSELHFGSCEASMLEIKIRNEFGELKGKWLTVSMVLDSHTDKPFQFGKYKVISDEASGDRKYTNITAFDAMHDIIHAEVVTWYDGLTFPMTLKEFRDSFFAYFGITQEETTLIQDDMIVEKTIDSNSISGKDVITAICELNGTFGHINRQGNFEYVSLERKFEYLHPGASIYPGKSTGLNKGKYPSEDIYPSDNLYPGQSIYPGMIMDLDYPKHDITPSLYRSCEYADFETELITKVQIRMEEGDIGAVTGKGNNCYIVEDNFLVYGKSSKELSRICRRLFGKLFGIQYRPFKAVVKGNPCIEVGDIVNIQAKYKDIEGYVLERTLKGIQALKDDFQANGVQTYSEKVNSVNKEISRLKGKTNVLTRTVEETKSTITDVENNLQSQITQNAEGIQTKVSKDNVISEINQSAEEVSIKADKISLEGAVTVNENVKILEDGTLSAKNGTFEGKIISNSAEITGGSIKIDTSSSGNSLIRLRSADSMRTSLYPGGIELAEGVQGNPDRYSYYGLSLMFVRDENGNHMIDATHSGIGTAYNISAAGNLTVQGTKSRVAKTKSYNERLLYCYEMPSPVFGDMGHGIIGEDGLCYVDIDPVFFETIDTNQSYHVFLQSYSENQVYVAERQQGHFVVKGTPNTEFDWEIKAKQLDFPMERLEEQLPEDDYKEPDYVALASEYLRGYEQEVLSYE